jgi:hypothetical protein
MSQIKTNNKLLLIFLIPILIGGSWYLLIRPNISRKYFIKKTQPILTPSPETPTPYYRRPTGADFVEQGYLVLSAAEAEEGNENWSLIYEKPGRPALKAELIIDENCQRGCDELDNGLRVGIVGIKEKNRVRVLEIHRIYTSQ